MSNINHARLKQYLDLEYNVLLIGLHGTAKTATVKSVFESAGLNWKYLSASTLDPWIDFCGIPKVIEKDGKNTLTLIRPDFLENCEALFIDELNRAPDKVTNAILEIIQFKSINGIKLPKLKIVWACINPEDDDDTYSVNHLDPAHMDRFHVHIHVPYKIDEDYFNQKYPTIAAIFIQWWKDLPGDIQKMVSPRRVDYAADAYTKGCRLEDFLPLESNPSALRKSLMSLPFHEQIKKILTNEAAEIFIKNINNSTKLLDLVKANDACAVDFFMKYGKTMPKELVEPFSELVYARKQGFEVIGSLEELINRLPDDKGHQGTAVLINSVNFDLLYKNGGSLDKDIRSIGNSQHPLIAKLANRCGDILIGCQANTLERILWGIEGKRGNKETNFHQIIKILSNIGGYFTPKQKNFINSKLYSRKLVDHINYI
jgi:hypothetical protein